MSEQPTMTVYRNPGLNLTHLAAEDGESTICKHYRIRRMDRFEIPLTQTTMWCTDCMSAVITLAQEAQNEQSA